MDLDQIEKISVIPIRTPSQERYIGGRRQVTGRGITRKIYIPYEWDTEPLKDALGYPSEKKLTRLLRTADYDIRYVKGKDAKWDTDCYRGKGIKNKHKQDT